MTDPDDDARTRAMPIQSRPDPDRTHRIEARAWSQSNEELPPTSTSTSAADSTATSTSAESEDTVLSEPRIQIIPAEATAVDPDTGARRAHTGAQEAVEAQNGASGAHPPSDDSADGDAASDADTPERPWYVRLRKRIPETVLGGRMQTSTAVLAVTWVLLLVLYGWLNPDLGSGAGDGNVVVPEGYQVVPLPTTEEAPVVTEPLVTTTPEVPESTTPTTGAETESGSATTSESAGTDSEGNSGGNTDSGTETSEVELPGGFSIPGLTQNDSDSGQSTSAP